MIFSSEAGFLSALICQGGPYSNQWVEKLSNPKGGFPEEEEILAQVCNISICFRFSQLPGCPLKNLLAASVMQINP